MRSVARRVRLLWFRHMFAGAILTGCLSGPPERRNEDGGIEV